MSNVILETTPNGLIMLDQDFLILQYNRAAGEILGLTPECVGMPIEMYLDGADFEKVRQGSGDIMGSRSVSANGKTVENSLVAVSNGDYLVEMCIRDSIGAVCKNKPGGMVQGAEYGKHPGQNQRKKTYEYAWDGAARAAPFLLWIKVRGRNARRRKEG